MFYLNEEIFMYINPENPEGEDKIMTEKKEKWETFQIVILLMILMLIKWIWFVIVIYEKSHYPELKFIILILNYTCKNLIFRFISTRCSSGEDSLFILFKGEDSLDF